MNKDSKPTPLSEQKVAYTVPANTASAHANSATENIEVRKDLVYCADKDTPLTMDIYYPPGSEGKVQAAVVLVTGFPDPGYKALFGTQLKEAEQYQSWGELIAASGMVAITYSNTEPETDIFTLLNYIRTNSNTLCVDKNAIGIWACSGNVPNALSVMLSNHPSPPKCAVLCYGYMMDLDDSSTVADNGQAFRFVVPCSGKSVTDLSNDIPLLVIRAGRDEMPGLNESIDLFVEHALKANLPITLINHSQALHAFDISETSDNSQRVIKQILLYLQQQFL
jgi:hypothetical protein